MMSRRIYPASSNVYFFAYDDETWELEVCYKHDNGNEPIYLYNHVPPKVWYDLQNAPSKGKFIWQKIRIPNAYPYDLINYSPEEIVSEKIVAPEVKDSWWKRFWRK